MHFDGLSTYQFRRHFSNAVNTNPFATRFARCSLKGGNSSILEKAKELSSKVAAMSTASEAREEELQQAEEMRRRLENQVAELQVEKEAVEQVRSCEERSDEPTMLLYVALLLLLTPLSLSRHSWSPTCSRPRRAIPRAPSSRSV